jgi:hypothetical protein
MTTTVPTGATHGRPLLRNGSATQSLPVFNFVIIDRSLQEPSASSVTQIADNALRLDFTDTVNTTHDGYFVNIYDGWPSADASRQLQLGPNERSVLVTFGPSDAPFEVPHLYVFELAPTGPRGVALDWANPWITMSTTARVTRNASASTIHGSAGHDDADRDGVVDRASAGSSGFRYPFDNRRLGVAPENWDVVEGSAFHSEPGLVTNTIALALTDNGTRFIAFHFDRDDPACRGVLLEGDKFSVFVDPLPIVDRCDPNGTGISIAVRGFGTDPWIKTETMSLETQLVLERQ